MGCGNEKCKDWNPGYDHNDNCMGHGMRCDGNLCKDYVPKRSDGVAFDIWWGNFIESKESSKIALSRGSAMAAWFAREASEFKSKKVKILCDTGTDGRGPLTYEVGTVKIFEIDLPLPLIESGDFILSPGTIDGQIVEFRALPTKSCFKKKIPFKELMAKLEEIRCGIIDVETNTEPNVHNTLTKQYVTHDCSFCGCTRGQIHDKRCPNDGEPLKVTERWIDDKGRIFQLKKL